MRPQRHHSAANRRPSENRTGRWLVGLHAAREAAKVRPEAISEIWVREDWRKNAEVQHIIEGLNVTPKVQPVAAFERLGSGHQGIAMCLKSGPEFNWKRLESAAYSRVLLASGLQDPHNLGAILRTAWLLDFQVLFVSESRSVSLTPSAIKVASGGAEHVPVVPAGNLLDTVKSLKDIGFWVYGLVAEASETLWTHHFHEKVAIVIGGEDSGIAKPLERQCDQLVSIPQVAVGASLNASVAAAIAMSEVTRQHFVVKKSQ